MSIKNNDFLVSTLERIQKTGVVPAKYSSEMDISKEVPTCVHTMLVTDATNFNSDEVASLHAEVDEETEWYTEDLHVGEVNVVPAGSAHLIIVLLF